jgi:hypothetical protein
VRFSVRTVSLTGFRTSSKPFKTTVQREPCQPFAITGFPPVIHNGECPFRTLRDEHPARKTQTRSTLCSSFTNGTKTAQLHSSALSFLRLEQCVFGACRSGRRSNLKRSLGGLLFAKPFRNLCSRMRIPGPGINYRGLLNSMPQVSARMQTNLDTCSLVLDFKIYTRTCNDVQGGIWRVNSCEANSRFVGDFPALQRISVIASTN